MYLIAGEIMKSFHQFYEFMQKQKALNEFGDIMTANLSQTHLQRDASGNLHYNFEKDGDKFQVSFTTQNTRINGVPLHGYEISLIGPQHYASTGMAGTKAVGIYESLLLATRKLLEEKARDANEPVQFLQFAGFEPEMNLVYERFYQRYLANQFTRYDRKVLIRNDVLQAIKDEHPEDAPWIDADIDSNQSAWQDELKDIRKSKIDRRKKGPPDEKGGFSL